MAASVASIAGPASGMGVDASGAGPGEPVSLFEHDTVAGETRIANQTRRARGRLRSSVATFRPLPCRVHAV